MKNIVKMTVAILVLGYSTMVFASGGGQGAGKTVKVNCQKEVRERHKPELEKCKQEAGEFKAKFQSKQKETRKAQKEQIKLDKQNCLKEAKGKEAKIECGNNAREAFGKNKQQRIDTRNQNFENLKKMQKECKTKVRNKIKAEIKECKDNKKSMKNKNNK